jgi:hypothetical protein
MRPQIFFFTLILGLILCGCIPIDKAEENSTGFSRTRNIHYELNSIKGGIVSVQHFNQRAGLGHEFSLEIWDVEQDYFYLKYKLYAATAAFDTTSHHWLLTDVNIRQNFRGERQTIRTADQLDTALSFRPSDIIKFYNANY